MTYRIIQKRKMWYVFSLALIAASIVFLALGGLRLGTDFTGGSQVQMKFAPGQRPSPQALQDAVATFGYGTPSVQIVDQDSTLVRVKEMTTEEHTAFLTKFKEKYPTATEDSYSSVGPLIGKELRQKAVTATILVLIAIILYITWAFRKSTRRLSSWAFGTNAIIALVHDIIITVGFFAMIGYIAKVEVDVLFVTALLTTLGFSVHDTIVVFDRLREGLRQHPTDQMETLLNNSVNTTLVRSINTSLTTLLVLTALYLFGGASIRIFVLTLIVGITIGTYSSIFLASPLLLMWERRK